MYRGRAYFKRNFYKQAVQDLSIAVHLDPNNWLALYYRACLFRKSNPLRALQDYSVSGTSPSMAHIWGFNLRFSSSLSWSGILMWDD